MYKKLLPLVKRLAPVAALACLIGSQALQAQTLTQELERGLGLSSAITSTTIANVKPSVAAAVKQSNNVTSELSLTQQLEQGLGLASEEAATNAGAAKAAAQDQKLKAKSTAKEAKKDLKKPLKVSQRLQQNTNDTITLANVSAVDSSTKVQHQMEASLAASQNPSPTLANDNNLLTSLANTNPSQLSLLETNNQQNLSQQIEALKQAMVDLNRDLFVLEEELLFPSSTQVAVYLSMDVGEYFALDAVELRINGDVKTYYLYTERQVNALNRGGVQRLYVGNVNRGEHELSAYFIGVGPENREYKRALSVQFTKNDEPVALALNVIDSSSKQQPLFEARVL